MSTKSIYILCLLLALHSGAIALIQNKHIANLQHNAPADIELICTGSTMKWVSVSKTQAAGQFVFVDFQPDNSDHPSPLLDVTCPVATLADNQSQINITIDTIQITNLIFLAIVESLYQRPYTLFAYRKSQPRSPPVSIAI
ncbi:hypothetical protein DRW07_01085 [Alteromonas sediminis]|uniref:Uncharacterized protein n=1 Tax=Alteromonas sediminis TaxID=2259342 RepID=A0A3N5Y9P8_9ALTE|nr:hypothetical protein [Alteromonas sediminis]RPJ68039.1 hypothetical protein DRW07_01085 [Alteromonas sediminis]